MWLNLGRGVRAIILATVLLGASFALHLQPAFAQSDQEQADADAAYDAEIQRAYHSFDLLARTFTKKKRSELINDKSYTDAEWAQLERAVKTNGAACRKGDAEACLAAGKAYETGDGVWIVHDIAFILYNDACNLGLGEGCRAFYDLPKSRFGYPWGRYEEATDRYLEKGCDRGDLVSCDRFAAALLDGTPPNQARADAILESACKAAGEDACISLSRQLLYSGTPEGRARALTILDTTCLRESAAACAIMADALGKGPDVDQAKINRYDDLACTFGAGGNCTTMGLRAYRGIGLAANRDLAAAYYLKACTIDQNGCVLPQLLAAMPQLEADCVRNDAKACAQFGEAFALRGSPEYDLSRAAPLLEYGCISGVSAVCAEAAEAIAMLGLDMSLDEQRIVDLYEKGCAGEDQYSCFAVAARLENDPEPAQRERAAALYSRLCDAQYRLACDAEEPLVGLVATARIRDAGENFTPPLPSDTPTDIFQPSEIMEVCFNGSERFRGKTYTQFNCDRRGKGINSERAQPGQAPWQALLWRPETIFDTKLTPGQRVLCGGSLIAQSWVLTAAHCLNDEGFDLSDPKVRSRYRIRLGVYSPGAAEGISYPILRVIRHPQFDFDNKLAFDVALIQYDTRAPTVDDERAYKNHPIHTIALDSQPVGVRKITAGMTAYAFGWGWTAEQKSTATDYLQIMKLDVSTEAACTALTGFTKALSNAALCAKGKAGTQTCYGDSGGPLVYYGDRAGRPVLIGVVSAGAKCGTTKSNRPSQYTRVAKVLDWIATYVPGIK
jgi:TPR repeat protein